MRWSLLSVLLTVGAGCSGSYTPPEDPIPSDAAIVVTTELAQAPTVSYAFLRSDIQIDCAVLGQLRGRISSTQLDVSWFEPARTITLREGERHAIPRRKATCDVMRVQHPTLGARHVTIEEGYAETLEIQEGGVIGNLWYEPDASGDLESCATTSPRAVSWSEPIPVGKRLRVEELTRDAGCTEMTIANEDRTTSWRVCTGTVESPLQRGDTIDVSLTGNDNATIRIDRGATTIWLGSGPLQQTAKEAEAINLAFTQDYACRPQTRTCGMLQMPGHLHVTWGRRRGTLLRSGDSLTLNDEAGSLEVSVDAAAYVPFASESCEQGTGTTTRFVAIEHHRANVTVAGT